MPHKNGKKILGVPTMGSEPRATGGLLEFASKFNGTYMHKKWSFNSERNVA